MFLREDRMEHVRQTHFNGGEDVDKTKSIWGIDGFRGLTLTEDNLWHDLFEDAQEAKGHLQGNGRCYREWTYLEGGFIGTLGEKYGYSYTRTYTVVYLQTGGLWTMFPGTNDSIQGT